MKKQTVAIVHYNTPELTEACILSLRKSGCGWPVLVLDNSDKRPFSKKMKGVKVLDNGRGQIIDFDAELSKYPNRIAEHAQQSNFGSMKHCMSVQYLWSVLKDGFILLDSDTLVKRDISELWQEEYAAVGERRSYPGHPYPVAERFLPFLLYMNVPKLVAAGAKFYDPKRCWMLQGNLNDKANWYDTGACLMEDVRRIKPYLVGKIVKIGDYITHLGSGSWRNNDQDVQKAWIDANRKLWFIPENTRIFICAHKDFTLPVASSVYEVADARKSGDSYHGVAGSFYSELLEMHRLSKRKSLPAYIGFCQYRKYFDFMNDVPDIPKLIKEHGCITVKAVELGKSVREHYAHVGNVEDIDICTDIIAESSPDFFPKWKQHIDGHYLHPASMFIMHIGEWRSMLNFVWETVNEYLKRIGGDIDKRIESDRDKYHLSTSSIEYQRRVGGQLCERLISAWIDSQYPNALQVGMTITSKK